MNIDNNLILIKGEDKTASVTSWRFDHYKPVVFITFNGQKEYPYNIACVEFLKNPKIIELEDRIALNGNYILSGAKQLQFFGRHCRVIYKSGYSELVASSSMSTGGSATAARAIASNCL